MIKRFMQWCAVSHRHEMSEQADGTYVLATDYDALAAAAIKMMSHYETCCEEHNATATLRELLDGHEFENCDGSCPHKGKDCDAGG